MSFFPMLLAAPIVVFVGALIGAIGIGGVLLVPLLTLAFGMGVHVAIATASFTYLFTGIVGVVEYARRGTIRWSTVIWLCVGGMPGAYLGAMTAWHMPGPILEVIIGFLVLLSGFQSLRSRRETTVEQKRLIPSALFGIGIVTGFCLSNYRYWGTFGFGADPFMAEGAGSDCGGIESGNTDPNCVACNRRKLNLWVH